MRLTAHEWALAIFITAWILTATVPAAIWGKQGLWSLLTIPIFVIAFWRIDW